MMLFDSHAHYNDEAFGDKAERDSVIKRAHDSGVIGIINAGTNPKTSREGIDLSEEYGFFYGAVGLHPEDIGNIENISSALEEIEALAFHEKAVAIGEIGLDYHYRDDNRLTQLTWFERQIELAKRLNLPVIVHDREAHGDCLDIVRRNKGVRGVFHSFSGSAEMARELVKLGWYISFSGVITFKNATRLAEIVPKVPLERLLIETDCPYLTPHPFRGKRNSSEYLKYTAEKMAELCGIEVEALSEITVGNTRELFNIK